MSLDLWLLFVATEAALCASPGPAVLYVSSQAVSGGFRASLGANLGIVTGNVVYFAASAVGLGTLILASHALFAAVKWCGVAYLVYLGLRMLLRGSGLARAQTTPKVRMREVYRGGVLVQLANPKNLVFFMAVLPPFIDPAGHLPLQILILGATSQAIEIAVLAAYGALASGAGRWLRTSRLAVWTDRAAGALLVTVGASLAFVRRPGA